MNFFHLELSASGPNQDQIIQKVKSNGGDAVQSSRGLLLAYPGEKSALEAMLAEIEPGMRPQVVPVTKDEADALPPNLAAFMKASG